MSDQAESSRRHFKRIQRRFIASVGTPDEDGKLTWSVVTVQNLSAGGIYFLYERDAVPGTVLKAKIHFPNRIIECSCTVVRRESSSNPAVIYSVIAVSFDDLKGEDRTYMDSFVQSVESQNKAKP